MNKEKHIVLVSEDTDMAEICVEISMEQFQFYKTLSLVLEGIDKFIHF